MQRPSCCLKSCGNQIIDESSTRVEIKASVPSSGFTAYTDRLVVSWHKNGEAVFHKECWEVLLQAIKWKSPRGKMKSKETSDKRINVLKVEKLMLLEGNETVEMFDANDVVEREARRVADIMKKAKHCIFFTGAGISTSAGLGDYRGKGGKWTEEDRREGQSDLDRACQEASEGPGPSKRRKTETISSQQATAKEEKEEEEEEVDYENLRPTYTHEAISKLMQLNRIKYLVSQNCDGLHLLSGIPAQKISELHGNVFVEKCSKCAKRYERPYYVCDDVCDIYLSELSEQGKTTVIKPKFLLKCPQCDLCHRTGRQCEKKNCKGQLQDTIINFGDDLEEDILDRAMDNAFECDLLVCLGTTLTVTPACHIVDVIKRPRRVVICNRQNTERDSICLKENGKGQLLGARVYGDCDLFMQKIMGHMMEKEELKKFDKNIVRKRKIYDGKRKTT